MSYMQAVFLRGEGRCRCLLLQVCRVFERRSLAGFKRFDLSRGSGCGHLREGGHMIFRRFAFCFSLGFGL